jgi:beta-glucosidase
MTYFPKDFLLGAATAAHQVEGNNTHSDFWTMEQVPGSMFKEPSGICLDHYNRYREDIDLLAGAGLNATAFRLSGRGFSRIRTALTKKKLTITGI